MAKRDSARRDALTWQQKSDCLHYCAKMTQTIIGLTTTRADDFLYLTTLMPKPDRYIEYDNDISGIYGFVRETLRFCLTLMESEEMIKNEFYKDLKGNTYEYLGTSTLGDIRGKGMLLQARYLEVEDYVLNVYEGWNHNEIQKNLLILKDVKLGQHYAMPISFENVLIKVEQAKAASPEELRKARFNKK